MNFRRIGHFGLLVALFAVFIVTVTVSAHVAQAAPIGSQFVPVAPCRLVDTRQPGQQSLAAGGSLRVAVSDRCGVPAGGGAVAVTITATDAATAGYLTAHAASTPLPDSSNVNYRPGAAVANSAIVALSADGAIEIFSSSAVQVIVDVNGVFVPVTANVAAGRFVPLPPSRLADTRLTADHRSGDLVVPIPAGVPSDATALAVSVTLTDADQGAAYVTAYPAGVARPTASVVNTDPLERAKAVTLFTPVSRDGLVLWRSAPSDVIVDVVGWFTGPSSAPGSDGLFVADGPRRVWDSRSTNDPLHAGGIVERSLVAGSAAAAVMNVTAVDATAPGFVTAYPAGMERPNVSMLNVTWRSPLASMSVVSMSSRGAALYASVGVHMIVDVTGWFLGAPVSTGAPTVANPMPSSGGPVLFVSDSSLAGIRWNGDLGWLQGAPIVADLESCRRLIGASCRGREGYAPENATQAVLTAPGNFDTLVIGTGYDDFAPLFAQGFDSVVRAARARGITRIVWFDYRELVGYSSPGHVSYAATFAANNATLRTMVASGAYPEVAIADWNGYSASHPGWFTSDGVHVTGDGTQEAAMYLSCTLAFLDRRPCPAGMGGPVAAGGWCASPDVVGATA